MLPIVGYPPSCRLKIAQSRMTSPLNCDLVHNSKQIAIDSLLTLS